MASNDRALLVSFIDLVKKHPCLWNYKLKEYSKSDVTGLAWNYIAAELKETSKNYILFAAIIIRPRIFRL